MRLEKNFDTARETESHTFQVVRGAHPTVGCAPRTTDASQPTRTKPHPRILTHPREHRCTRILDLASRTVFS